MRLIKESLIFFFLLLFATFAYGVIQGSSHDFSTLGWSGGEICLPCHTPHNSNMSVPDAPLWNHQVTTAAFTLYNSPTLDVLPEAPRGVTKLCLSCHDGTVALESFAGNIGSDYITGNHNLGIDLSNDHPVSILWQHQTDINGGCGRCHQLHPVRLISVLPFFDGYVECATCHDVHNSTAYAKLLRKPLQGSEICFHCHDK